MKQVIVADEVEGVNNNPREKDVDLVLEKVNQQNHRQM